MCSFIIIDGNLFRRQAEKFNLGRDFDLWKGWHSHNGMEGEEGGRSAEEGEGTGGDSIENGPIIQVSMDGSAAAPAASPRCKGPTSARTEDRPQLAPRSMDEWMIRRRTGCT